MVQLPEAAMTKNDLPSLIRETDLFVPVSKVNLLPWLLGVVPAMPANTFVPLVSCEPVRLWGDPSEVRNTNTPPGTDEASGMIQVVAKS